MTADVADDIQEQLNEISTRSSDLAASDLADAEVQKRQADEAAAAMKAKQLRWRAMALGCHMTGELSVQDAANMVQLMVGKT